LRFYTNLYQDKPKPGIRAEEARFASARLHKFRQGHSATKHSSTLPAMLVRHFFIASRRQELPKK
jgi:hypothetical protein